MNLWIQSLLVELGVADRLGVPHGSRRGHEHLHAGCVRSLERRRVVDLAAREHSGLRLQHVLAHLMLIVHREQVLTIVLLREGDSLASRQAIDLVLRCQLLLACHLFLTRLGLQVN